MQHGNKRLLVLYFDMLSMPKVDQLRAQVAAEKFIRSQMSPPDLMAIMEYNAATVSVLCDFTGDRDKLQGVIENMIVGNAQQAEVAVSPDNTAPAGLDENEFKIFTTDRTFAAIQTAVSILGTPNEKKAMVIFANGINLDGMDNQAQLHATVDAAIRCQYFLVAGGFAQLNKAGYALSTRGEA